jgi:hypothetical protein
MMDMLLHKISITLLPKKLLNDLSTVISVLFLLSYIIFYGYFIYLFIY